MESKFIRMARHPNLLKKQRTCVYCMKEYPYVGSICIDCVLDPYLIYFSKEQGYSLLVNENINGQTN